MTRPREEDVPPEPDAKAARLQRVTERGTFKLEFPNHPESVLHLDCDDIWAVCPEEDIPVHDETPVEALRDFSVAMPRLSLKDVDVQRLPQQARAALEFLVLLNPCEIIPDASAARQPVLLPRQKPEHQGRRTLVLDLDETLVHCHCQPVAPPAAHPDIHLELENGEPKAILKAKVFVRPGARQLLLFAAERFEVVVFTASAAIYADKVLDWLDPGQKLIAYRLYREACTELAGGHFKDLRRLGRSLDDVVLVDNSPLALGLRPQNGMLITSWYGDDHQDQELMILMGMLAKLETVKSLPEFLEHRFGFSTFLKDLRATAPRTRPGLTAAVRLQMFGMTNNSGAVTQVTRGRR